MPTAFTDHADFSGITTEEPLLISAVVHQADIDVDEQGTEASAATAVMMRAASLPLDVVDLTVDRPFLFALRDLETGAVVFLGRIADPTAGTGPGPRPAHFRLISIATMASTAPDTTTCDISTMASEVSNGCSMSGIYAQMSRLGERSSQPLG